jgi:hypothetical protein
VATPVAKPIAGNSAAPTEPSPVPAPVGSGTEYTRLLESTQALAKTAGYVVSAVVASSALFYVAGFVIVNASFLHYSLRDFELSKPEYLTSGIGFTSVVTVITLFVWVFEQRFSRPTSGWSGDLPRSTWLWRVEWFFLTFAVYFVVVLLLDFVSTPPATWRWLFNFRTLLSYSCLFLGVLVTMFALSVLHRLQQFVHDDSVNKRQRSAAMTLQLTNILVLIPLFLFTWGQFIYPRLSPVFGGGRPMPARLVAVDDASQGLLEQAGVQFDDKGVSLCLEVLSESSSTLIVLLPKNPNGNTWACLEKLGGKPAEQPKEPPKEQREEEKLAVKVKSSLVSGIIYWFTPMIPPPPGVSGT